MQESSPGMGFVDVGCVCVLMIVFVPCAVFRVLPFEALHNLHSIPPLSPLGSSPGNPLEAPKSLELGFGGFGS